MPKNSMRTNANRADDKAGMVIMFAAIVLIGIAALLLVNGNRTEVAEAPTTVNVPVKASVPPVQPSNGQNTAPAANAGSGSTLPSQSETDTGS